MNCYVCDSAGRTVTAVAVCGNCGIGLCRPHLDQDLLATRVQGVVRAGCTHRLVQAARSRREAQVAVGTVSSASGSPGGDTPPRR